jgi:hypothetical protein
MASKLAYAIVLTSALVAIGPGQANAASENIGFRPGGDLYSYMDQAFGMLKGGRSYRVTGDQYSAAAMQVVYLKNHMPGRICATRNARLNFHLGYDRETKAPIEKPDAVWVAFIGQNNLRRLGRLPQYGKGFKTVRASDYLGLCK